MLELSCSKTVFAFVFVELEIKFAEIHKITLIAFVQAGGRRSFFDCVVLVTQLGQRVSQLTMGYG